MIYKDNASCIRQMTLDSIKANFIKHVSPQIFTYFQDLVVKGHIKIGKVEFENNIAGMLTKALAAYKHKNSYMQHA